MLAKLGASSYSASGNNLIVNLALTFKTPFAGAKNIYAQAMSTTNEGSGWHQMGTWTVPQALTSVSVTPSSGAGLTQTFSFLYTDLNGMADIQWVQMLVNTAVSGSNACYLHFYRPSSLIELADNAGTNWTYQTIGTAGTLSNSQCSLNVGASSAYGSGNNLTVTLALTFSTGFVETKNVYMRGAVMSGSQTSWEQKGTWTVACTYGISPTSQSFTSSAGTGTVGVSCGAGCTWTAVSNATSWLHVTSGASGTGNGTVGYSVDLNTGSARSGTMTIAGQTFTVSQDGALVITTSSPLPNGTVGVFYSQTLAATGGTTPYTWSVISGQLPPGLSLSSGGVLSGTPTTANTYNFTVQVSGGGTATKAFSLTVLLPIPTQWKAINYSPRHHQYFRMLYDWYNWDSDAGKYVYQMVDDDLQRLKDNGFNLIHLYLWDRRLLTSVNPSEPAGFTDSPGSPNPSGSQFSALDAFVGKAENKGIFVVLHFASGRFIDLMGSAVDPDTATTEYSDWAGAFIQYLTPAHKNVLLWGLAYAVFPAVSDPTGSWSTKWQKAYKKVDDIARQYSPSSGTLGLIGANVPWVLEDPNNPSSTEPPSDIIPRSGAGYGWKLIDTQKVAKTMRDLLTSIYGFQKDPDAYLMQLYNPNALDLQNNLVSLTTNTGGDPTRLAVPAGKIFVVEWATSSAIGNSYGNPTGISAFAAGDSNTPTTTAAGQAQWLTNSICAYRNAGINKYAYWAMYDPWTIWSTSPWNKTGQDLAWNGFWGLSTDSGVDKAAWSALRSFYLTDPSIWSCPSPPVPIISLLSNNDYFTLGQPVRVTWTAADVSSMSLDRGYGGSYSCNSGVQLSPTVLTGSCAYTDATAFSTTGSQTATLTGLNGPQSAIASTSLSVGDGPIVNAATNQAYDPTIHTNDWIIVWGNGFSVTGGNTLQFTSPGNPDVWMYEGDGYAFWDQSYRQINAFLGGRLAPGTWTLYVRNGYSGIPSAGFTVTIHSCPN